MFSTFAQKFQGDCGILRLMDDLNKGLSQPGAIMLGGGNPSHIPEVQAVFRDRMAHILDGDLFDAMVGNYDGPAGNGAFKLALVDFFNEHFGWGVSADNIALTNGSQTAFFMLFNMLAGEFPDGSKKRILLPLAPEYIGYEDAGIGQDYFVSYRPTIEFLEDNYYKYHVDFDQIEVTDDINAICVSRPTNPTGNVLTQAEIDQLSAIAKENQIPLIIDNAYGTPFPSIIFTEAEPTWEPHIIMCMSLSKLGLPGTRTGIIIADKPIIDCLTGMNAVMSLAPGGVGSYLAHDLVKTGSILPLSNTIIKPHYQEKAEKAVGWLREALADVEFYIHKPEGAIFLWLWFKDMPITSAELYERLSERQVLIVPGHYFFPGLDGDSWQHKDECIRMNYSQDEATVRAGINIIAEEVKKAYNAVAVGNL